MYFMCVCVHVSVCMCVCKPAEGILFPGTGSIRGCELHHMDAMN